MRRLPTAAIALLMSISSGFAYWDYFPVIEGGSAEAKIDSDFNLKIRYGIAENWEIFAANDVNNLWVDYGIGARYQVIPDMLSVSMDLGICSWDRGAGSYSGSFGLVPGVQFSTNFTDAISFGAGMGLGFEFDAFNGKVKNGGELERGVMVNLSLGAEIDYTLNENVLLWGGMNYAYDRLNVEGGEAPVLKYALHPAIGAVFSAGNISVGTYLDVRLNAITIDAKETIGLSGGVDFASL